MAVNFDVNSFVVEKPNKAISQSANGDGWYSNQIQNLSIKVDGTEETHTDVDGNTVLTVTRGKTCTVSFEVKMFDLNIIAAQNGTKKEVAGPDVSTITTPAFEEVTIDNSNKESIVLAHDVKAVDSTYSVSVNQLNSDGSLKRVFKQGSAVSDGIFTYTSSTKTLAFNSGDLVPGDTLLIVYEYESDAAVRVAATAKDFPKTSKLYIQVRGYDVCDPETLLYAYYRFPKAKLKSSYQTDVKIDTPISMEFDCAVDYCGTDKLFYDLVMPSAE